MRTKSCVSSHKCLTAHCHILTCLLHKFVRMMTFWRFVINGMHYSELRKKLHCHSVGPHEDIMTWNAVRQCMDPLVTRLVKWRFWYFSSYPEKAVKHKISLPVIWYIMTLTLRHCNIWLTSLMFRNRHFDADFIIGYPYIIYLSLCNQCTK